MRGRNESGPFCVASDRNPEYEFKNWAPRLGETRDCDRNPDDEIQNWTPRLSETRDKFKIEHRA